MKNLRILFTSCFFMTLASAAQAQFMRYSDFRPVMYIDYTNIEGTPYLYADWMPGTVKLNDGTASKDPMDLKYNVVTDEVSFKDKSGQELVFVKPVTEFTLQPSGSADLLTRKYRSGYKDIEGIIPSAFFEVLADGKVQLLKRFNKIIFESTPIGSASKLKEFIEKTKYFLVINGKAVQVKNDKKAIFAALSDKQAELEGFSKANKIRFKSDADLGKLVIYYNSL